MTGVQSGVSVADLLSVRAHLCMAMHSHAVTFHTQGHDTADMPRSPCGGLTSAGHRGDRLGGAWAHKLWWFADDACGNGSGQRHWGILWAEMAIATLAPGVNG